MRRSFLKATFVVGLVTGLILLCGTFSPSNAMPVAAPTVESIAAFKVVDNFGFDGDNGDNMVRLSFFSTLTLQYKYEGGGWADIDLLGLPGLYNGTLDVATGDDRSEVVYFKTNSGSTTAGVFFYGFDNPLWNSVVFGFDLNDGITGLVFATPGKGDHVAPVPIPAALWLFGSGLLGLIGIRRKITH